MRGSLRVKRARARLCAMLVALLPACAATPDQHTWVKAGVADADREKDSAACWDYALNSPEGQQKANMVKTARLIGGGPLALLVDSAESSANNGDPKKVLANQAAHNDCMAEKGYEAKF
jgi:hypothetical protein